MKIRHNSINSHDREDKSKSIATSCYYYSQVHLHYIIQLQNYAVFYATLLQHKTLHNLFSQHKKQSIIIKLSGNIPRICATER